MEAAPHPWPTLGVLLMRDGLVQKEILEDILSQQRDARGNRISGSRLGEILVERGLVTETQVAKLIAEQYELPYVELEESDVNLGVATLLPRELSERLSALPISSLPDGSLLVAVSDPATVVFSDELRRELEAPLRFVVVSPEAFATAVAFVEGNAPLVFEAAPEAAEPESEAVVVDLYPEEVAETPVSEMEDDPFVRAERAVAHLWPPLGALLIREGLVSDAELQAALAQQRLTASKRLGEILVDRGAVTPADIARLVAEQYELPFVDLAVSAVDPVAAARLPEDIARRYSALPIRYLADDSLQVVVADPTNVLYSDELRAALTSPITLAVAAPGAIEAAIAFAFHHPPAFEATVEAAVATETAPAQEAAPISAAPALELAKVASAQPEEAVAEMQGEVAEVEMQPEVVADTYDELAADVHDEAVAETQEEAHPSFVAEELAEILVVGEIPELFETHESAEGTDVRDEITATDEDAAPEPGSLEVVGARSPVEEPEPAEDVVEHAEPDDEVVKPAEPTAIDQVLADAVEAVTHAAVEEDELDDVIDVAEIPAPEDLEITGEGAATEVDDGVPEVESEGPPSIPSADEAEARPPDDRPIDALEHAIDHALALGASTIHVSPHEEGLVARARVDGVIRKVGTIPSSERAAATSTLKELDHIGTDGSSVDVRVTVIPTALGEKVTVRVLRRAPFGRGLGDLGMAPDTEDQVRRALEHPFGLFVACGPATSGATTTLYAALQALSTPERSIATVEDPVEYLVHGVDQVEVDPSSGLTFASGLASVLDSDPDVVLVGQLPDEIAELATRAAATQCLVLSSVRAQSLTGAIEQLFELDIEPTVLAETLTGVIAQRLVRRTCDDCRETFYATELDLTELGRPSEEAGRRLLARGRGCEACGGTGYHGRVGVFELLPLTEKIRALIAEQAPARKIERAAREGGLRTLREDGIRLCLEGLTTAAEIARALGDRTPRRVPV